MGTRVPLTSASELSNFFAQKIVGQPTAVERIVPFVQTYRAGLNHPHRPLGVFLLLGPTGTGKTRTVEVLAEALHGDPQSYLRIDCGEFQMEHEVAKLIGAPPGYLGHRETVPMLSNQKLGATLTPECDLSLLLLDEIEKAAPSLGRLLLGVLDKGRLTLGDGSVVNFDHSLIFLTSNLGAREMMREMSPSFGFDAKPVQESDWAQMTGKLEAVALAAVRKRFSPEFVNRIDAVITYGPLSADSTRQVLTNQIKELQEHLNTRLGSASFELSLSEPAREFLLTRGVSLEYGVRELKRVVYRFVTQPLAALVAESGVTRGHTVVAEVSKDGEMLEFRIQGESEAVEAPANPSVLIVDDNKPLLKFLKSAIGKESWSLAVASSAQAAIQLAAGTKFDIALIDYMLPDLDGAALSLKLLEQRPGLQIVLMTGGGTMAFPKHHALADVPILQKPFLIDDVIQLLRSKLSGMRKFVTTG